MFKLNSLEIPGCVVIGLMSRFGFAKVLIQPKDPSRNVVAINMTLLNIVLKIYGPMSESNLLKLLLQIQVFYLIFFSNFKVFASFIAFLIRYFISYIFF